MVPNLGSYAFRKKKKTLFGIILAMMTGFFGVAQMDQTHPEKNLGSQPVLLLKDLTAKSICRLVEYSTLYCTYIYIIYIIIYIHVYSNVQYILLPWDLHNDHLHQLHLHSPPSYIWGSCARQNTKIHSKTGSLTSRCADIWGELTPEVHSQAER